jgi:hypothetical protein
MYEESETYGDENEMRRAAMLQAIRDRPARYNYRGEGSKTDPRDLRVDELSLKELGELYGLPVKFPLNRRSPVDRDPVRHGKAYAVGKWLAARKTKKQRAKPKKETTKKTTKNKKTVSLKTQKNKSQKKGGKK